MAKKESALMPPADVMEFLHTMREACGEELSERVVGYFDDGDYVPLAEACRCLDLILAVMECLRTGGAEPGTDLDIEMLRTRKALFAAYRLGFEDGSGATP